MLDRGHIIMMLAYEICIRWRMKHLNKLSCVQRDMNINTIEIIKVSFSVPNTTLTTKMLTTAYHYYRLTHTAVFFQCN